MDCTCPLYSSCTEYLLWIQMRDYSDQQRTLYSCHYWSVPWQKSSALGGSYRTLRCQMMPRIFLRGRCCTAANQWRLWSSQTFPLGTLCTQFLPSFQCRRCIFPFDTRRMRSEWRHQSMHSTCLRGMNYIEKDREVLLLDHHHTFRRGMQCKQYHP